MKKLIALLIFQMISIKSVQAIEIVSIVALLSDPHKYNNVTVVFDGYFDLECSDPAIYISKEASDNMVTSLALGLEIGDAECEKLSSSKFNKKYLSIRGVMIATPRNTINTGTAYEIGKIKEFIILDHYIKRGD